MHVHGWPQHNSLLPVALPTGQNCCIRSSSEENRFFCRATIATYSHGFRFDPWINCCWCASSSCGCQHSLAHRARHGSTCRHAKALSFSVLMVRDADIRCILSGLTGPQLQLAVAVGESTAVMPICTYSTSHRSTLLYVNQYYCKSLLMLLVSSIRDMKRVQTCALSTLHGSKRRSGCLSTLRAPIISQTHFEVADRGVAAVLGTAVMIGQT
jgi:hypothetical protein